MINFKTKSNQNANTDTRVKNIKRKKSLDSVIAFCKK